MSNFENLKRIKSSFQVIVLARKKLQEFVFHSQTSFYLDGRHILILCKDAKLFIRHLPLPAADCRPPRHLGPQRRPRRRSRRRPRSRDGPLLVEAAVVRVAAAAAAPLAPEGPPHRPPHRRVLPPHLAPNLGQARIQAVQIEFLFQTKDYVQNQFSFLWPLNDISRQDGVAHSSRGFQVGVAA